MAILTAVVPATDDPPTLERCLAAIRRADAPPESVVVVREPPHAGPAAARNAGAARASGDVLVFVDADVEPHPDAFARIRAAFDDDPALVALFGSYDDRPAAPGVVSRFRNLLHHHVHQRHAGPATTFWAGLGAIRREPFAAAGGFDAERYPRASIEDVELGTRLAALGTPIVLDPAVRGTHLKRWTLASMVTTDFARRGVPWVRLSLRERHVPATLNLGKRERLAAGAAVAAAAAVVAGRPRAAALALGALVVVERDFYGLLLRRLGPAGAAAGLGLHVVHHVTSAAAVPTGIVTYALRG